MLAGPDPVALSSHFGISETIQANGASTETARFQRQNRRYLASSNAETSVETVIRIANIFGTRMHCKTALLSRTVASAR